LRREWEDDQMQFMSHGRRVAAAGAIGAAVMIAGCDSGTPNSSANAAAAVSPEPGTLASSQQTAQYLDHIIAPPEWKLALWAVGGGKYSNPDAIELDGQNVWVGYQNASVKDGSDNTKTSTVVEYTLAGKVLNTWPVPGHVDGLRIDPATHKAWATSNEDAAPLLNIIDPASWRTTPSGPPPTRGASLLSTLARTRSTPSSGADPRARCSPRHRTTPGWSASSAPST
jgi:hypothetical protein